MSGTLDAKWSSVFSFLLDVSACLVAEQVMYM